MEDSKELSPKIYRKLLTSIYIENSKDAKAIKDKFSRNGNPIVQKENRYFSPMARRNVLTQEYIKKMTEKPEKAHIKRIPIQRNLSCSLTVIRDQPQRPGIRFNPKLRKNQSSMSCPKIERQNKKHLSKNNYYKYFYLDNFNSIKQNENDVHKKHLVSQN